MRESRAPASDIAALYSRLAGKLEAIVRLSVVAPDPVIEDSCQFAWDRLVRNSDRVRQETALAWLAMTATREAFKLTRHGGRELSLDAQAESGDESALRSPLPGPPDIVECRERLAAVTGLPPRQQRMVWWQAAGLSYEEIAARAGCTVRTVERQLMRAKRTLRSTT